MIRAFGEIDQPDGITLTVTLTMTVGEWKQVAAQLDAGSYWPHGKSASLIKEVIRKMTANVTEIARPE